METFKCEYNPFELNVNTKTNVWSFDYDIESILQKILRKYDNIITTKNGTEIKEVNFNPFVYDDNGNKIYYQRDFVWDLEHSQNLIQSIYNNVDCGKIVFRQRSDNDLEEMSVNKNETELYFYDVVDGKQRLITLLNFIDNKFTDKQGYYYKDISNRAKKAFNRRMCFSFAVMNDKCTDKDTINQFNLLNFAGVPQSTEHMDFINNIYK